MIKSKKELKYLLQLFKEDNVKLEANNMILSPVGSGKTTLIMDFLRKKYIGNKLMLVSTISLKDSTSEEEHTITSQEMRRKKLGITDEDVHVMTYAEFGKMVKWGSWKSDFLDRYSVIFCDEIHSLIDYYLKHDSNEYAKAIDVLFQTHKNKTIFYFTATTEKIDKFMKLEDSHLYDRVNMNIIDYLQDERIMRHTNSLVYNFTRAREIEDIINGIEDMRTKDEKGFIYNERIDEMKKVEELLKNKGIKSILIWSVNNEKHPMTEEQLYVRSVLLKTGKIPDEYDFLIINGSMREGWNLHDKRFKFAIINTLDETSKIQARGRLRFDLFMLWERVKGEVKPIELRIIERERALGVIEKVLGKELDNEAKNVIAEELNIIREEDDKLVKWPTIVKALEKYGYIINNSRVKVDGKRVSVSIITKNEAVNPSSETRAKSYLRKLGALKFDSKNKDSLSNYVGGNPTAFKHIKANYKKYVCGEAWSERKFADVTYLLMRDNKLFSSRNYIEYGLIYIDLEEVEVLTERAKYEPSSQSLLEKAKKAAKARKLQKDEELLAHMMNNGWS